jgi:hypothetical protein
VQTFLEDTWRSELVQLLLHWVLFSFYFFFHFIYLFFETGSYCVAQAGRKLLCSSNP